MNQVAYCPLSKTKNNFNNNSSSDIHKHNKIYSNNNKLSLRQLKERWAGLQSFLMQIRHQINKFFNSNNNIRYRHNNNNNLKISSKNSSPQNFLSENTKSNRRRNSK